MKHLLTTVLIALICTLSPAKSYLFEQNGICYRIVDNQAIVAPYSDEWDQNLEHFSGVINIPSQVTYQGKQYPVTGIAPKTFLSCISITEVFIPNSVTTIGDEAFKNDNYIVKIHIGSGLKEIGKDALYGTLFVDLELDAANTHFTFEDHVLYTADHKRAITAGAPLSDWKTPAPDIVLHDDVETIDNAFCPSRFLNTLKFGSKVKSIGEYAFFKSLSETNNQQSLILPDGIEYIGQHAFYECIRIDTLHLPDNLTRIEPYSFSYVAPTSIHMPKKLKVICDGAFACSAGGVFRDLVLPEGLDSIGQYAFSCISCDSLIIPSTVRYLSYNSLDNFSGYIEIKAPLDSLPSHAMPSQGVKELILPKTLTKLGDYSLYPCYKLERITWPDALTHIGNYALAGNKLFPLVVPSTVTYLGMGAFADNVWEPRTVYFTSKTPPTCDRGHILFEGIQYEESKVYVPRGCKSAYEDKQPWTMFGTFEEYDEIVIPPTPTRYDFQVGDLYYNIISDKDLTCEVSYDLNYITEKNTYKLKEVTVPASVTYGGKTYTVVGIENDAFDGTPLQHIDLPKSIISLQAAFYNCTDLVSIEIPGNVTDLGAAFCNCSKLTTIHVPEKVENLASAFSGCINLESVNIPNSVQYINNTFNGCKKITSLEIPDHITEIGDRSFYGCSSLTSIKLPSELTKLCDLAFFDCKSLKSIVLPAKLNLILQGAFDGCDSLTDIICLSPTFPYLIGPFAHFSNYQATVHVPAGSKANYQSSEEWSCFANIVEDAESFLAIQQLPSAPRTIRRYDLQGRPVGPQYRGLVIRSTR